MQLGHGLGSAVGARKPPQFVGIRAARTVGDMRSSSMPLDGRAGSGVRRRSARPSSRQPLLALRNTQRLQHAVHQEVQGPKAVHAGKVLLHIAIRSQYGPDAEAQLAAEVVAHS